ncbi:MAG TPA: CsgG/HfaB family protein [Gemmatimonadales bacterium]
MTPAEVVALEAERARFAGDADVLTRIGVRFYEGQEYPRALDVLTAAMALRPTFTTAVYLGLTHEAVGHLDSAEVSYRAAGSSRMTRAQRDQLDSRLAALARTRLRAEARASIAREAALASTPPEPGTIAVMPWTFIGTDADLRPLGIGVAHLVLTDLSRVSAFKLVERERVQVLIEEMELANLGRVDPRTAARAGRLLRAERVVHGIVRQTRDGIQLEAQVFRTDDGRIEASQGAGDRLERLFALEKGILLSLVDQMGVPVSPAERRAITERPIQDMQSFLALSRGLEAQARPPTLNSSALTRLASPVAPTEMAGRAATLTSAIAVVAPSTGGGVDRRTRLPVANPRLPEALRQDNPSRIAGLPNLIIIIPRP